MTAPAQPALSLRTLLHGVVDYAGLFPPAQQSMAAAAADYATHREGPHAWALGRFVLPVARLDELGGVLPGSTGRSPWRLAVLPGTDLAADRAAIDAFNVAHGPRALVDTIEARAADAAAVHALADRFHPAFQLFVEAPLTDAMPAVLDAVRDRGVKAKVRTGGVTADAFPSPSALAGFLAACAARGITCKATAGLHHPLRGEYRLTYAADAPQGTMFGFLNVLLAACLLREGGDVATATALLEERDPSAFRFEGSQARWREHTLELDALAAGRGGFIAGFGSCSFAEPVADLAALSWL